MPSRLQTIAFKAAPIPLMLVSADGRIVETNAALDSLFEYEPGELTGMSVESLMPENLRARHVELREAFMLHPSSKRIGQDRELFGLSRLGRVITLEVHLNPVEIDDERFVVASVLDASSGKPADQRYRLAVDAAASGIVMAEPDGSIVFANRHACEIFGYSLFEMLGLSIDVLVPEQHRGSHAIYRTGYTTSPCTRAMADGRDIHGRHKCGKEFAVTVSLAPIGSGAKQLIMATINDVSR